MGTLLQFKFAENWNKYFGNAELPVCMWFAYESNTTDSSERKHSTTCFIAELASVRKGKNHCVNKQSLGCGGARRYLGYSDKLKPDFEYFLACGKDQMEGERYVKIPEKVLQWLNNQQFITVHNRTAYFKRWDKVEVNENPELLIFFATPDVLSGLFTLFNYCNFREVNIEPSFAAGCISIITKPYLNKDKAFRGLFDPTARKCVTENILTFLFHFKNISAMNEVMESSFLSTHSWALIKNV